MTIKPNKIKHAWTVLCNRSVIDTDTNVISLFDVFEQVEVGVEIKNNNIKKQTINVPLNYEVVSLWHTPDSQSNINFDFKIKLKDPENKLLNEFTKSVKLPKGKNRVRTRIKIQGLSITNSGLYQFEVFSKTDKNSSYKQVAAVPLQLTIKKVNRTTQRSSNNLKN